MSETKQVGRYVCHRKLGSGGMAEIYQARLPGVRGFTKEVAIKLMHRHLATTPSIVDLFVNEARITAELDHPNIVTVFELGKHEGQLFLVMELVDGLDLGALLARLGQEGRTMDWDVALAIAMEVTRALQFLHACLPGRQGRVAPVVHRDLSPGNIMLSHCGAVKLLDFGVAKTLLGDDETDTIARGKWHYMSPEQVRGEPLDGRSDLFSLGAVLFELLTGRQAFKGQTVVDSMRKVEQADLPPAPDLEPVLEELLATLLARERQARYDNASVALEAMAQTLMLRGKTTGPQQIATLLQTLDTAARPAVAAAAAGPVLAAVDSQYLGVGEQTDIRTIPGRDPDGRTAGTDDAPGEVTQPRARSARPARMRVTLPGPRVDGEPAEVTEEQLTGPGGIRLARSAAGMPHLNVDFDDLFADDDPTTDVQAPDDEALADVEALDDDTFAGAEAPDGNDDDPVEAPGAATASAPRGALEPLLPLSPTADGPPPRPAGGLWTGRSRLVLVLALLATLIAAVAIYLAVGQQRDRPSENGNAPRPHPVTRPLDASPPPPPAASAPAPGPRGTARAAPADAGAARTPPLAPPRPARLTPAPGGTVPAKGPVGQGQLDVITDPAGVRVFVNGTYRGRSPLRAVVPAGAQARVALSHPGRGLYKTRMWIPAAVGRRLQILLPFLRQRFLIARAGRTALQVTCRTAGLHRVYIDGRDTGHDCPTPPLAVLPVVHFVALYLPTTGKTVWRKLRPPPGKVTTVTWDH